ncbi:hypothetical protein ACQPU1_13325 [Clostridium paraputrificum]|uniref:hypothetical protein n=1 Tax=Clostridium TaxID=1485 RepID=UPI003D335367
MINLKVTKFADRNYLFIGFSNRVRYSIIIENQGDESANSVRVSDILSRGAFVVPGTITINGCRQNKQFCCEPISIGSIGPGESAIVSMVVEVNASCPPLSIVNRAIVSYFDNQGNKLSVQSNELVLPVYNLSVCIIKSVDKVVAKVGEVLSYSVLIRNTGNVDISDVTFFDQLPENLLLLPSTVLINSVPQFIDDLGIGIDLGTIVAGGNVVISFQAEILPLPKSSVVTNVANIDFSYTVNDGGILITSTGESISNPVTTKLLNCIC